MDGIILCILVGVTSIREHITGMTIIICIIVSIIVAKMVGTKVRLIYIYI